MYFVNKQGLDNTYVDYVGEIERCYEVFKASKFKNLENEYLLDLSTKVVIERKRESELKNNTKALNDIADSLNYPKDYFGTEGIAYSIEELAGAVKQIADENGGWVPLIENSDEFKGGSILETLKRAKGGGSLQ